MNDSTAAKFASPWLLRWEAFAEAIWQPWYRYQLSRPLPKQLPDEEIGPYGERLSALFLERKGYFILERSFRKRTGEIDIVAVWRKRVIVFVEVKTSYVCPENSGGPADRVDDRKQKKITDTALKYLKQHRLLDSVSGRFDVIEVCIQGAAGLPTLRHFENAFPAVGDYQFYS